MLRIRPLAIVMSLALAAASGLALLSFLMMQDAFSAARNAYQNQHLSYRLADELRQSSDDITRNARTYVVTGDTKWEEQFLSVIAIRNGEKPRPVDYHRIYWDFVAATGRAPRPTTQTRCRGTTQHRDPRTTAHAARRGCEGRARR